MKILTLFCKIVLHCCSCISFLFFFRKKVCSNVSHDGNATFNFNTSYITSLTQLVHINHRCENEKWILIDLKIERPNFLLFLHFANGMWTLPNKCFQKQQENSFVPIHWVFQISVYFHFSSRKNFIFLNLCVHLLTLF